MNTYIKYILITATRDLLFAGITLLTLAAMLLSHLFGYSSIVEEGQMALAFMAGASRLIIMTGLIVFVCFHVRRLFETREIEMMLTKPISRNRFILAYSVGFGLIATLLCLPAIVMISLIFSGSGTGFVIWSGTLLLEALIVVNIALAVALIMRSVVASILACFSFYVLSRLMGFFIAMVESKFFSAGSEVENFAVYFLKFSSAFLPRLDLFSQARFLTEVTPDTEAAIIAITQSVVYIPLLVLVGMFDFRRKQF